MSTNAHGLDEAAVEQTTRNIGLVGEFLQEVLADPGLLAEIPSGATVVLLPHDDPALAQANFALGERASAQGKDVWVYRMRVPQPDARGWAATERRAFQVKTIKPRWPVGAEIDLTQVVIAHDPDADTLLIDLFGGRRPLAGIPMAEDIWLLVDVEAQLAAGYFVEHVSRHEEGPFLRLLSFARLVSREAGEALPADESARTLERDELAWLLQHADVRSA